VVAHCSGISLRCLRAAQPGFSTTSVREDTKQLLVAAHESGLRNRRRGDRVTHCNPCSRLLQRMSLFMVQLDRSPHCNDTSGVVRTLPGYYQSNAEPREQRATMPAPRRKSVARTTWTRNLWRVRILFRCHACFAANEPRGFMTRASDNASHKRQIKGSSPTTRLRLIRSRNSR
jgi:hypothetical protein